MEAQNEWQEHGFANSRFDQGPRRATKFAKFHSEKGPSLNTLQRKCLTNNNHPLRRLLPPFRGKKMISSETKLFGSSKAWPSGGLDCVQRCN